MEKMWGNDQLGQENPFKHRINTKPLCELHTCYKSTKGNDDKTNKNQVTRAGCKGV